MTNKVLALMNMTFAGWAYLELLDELKETEVYRHVLRTRVNALIPELEKALEKDIMRFWGTETVEEDLTIYRIMDGWKGIMVKVKDVKPDFIPALAEMIGLMIEDPGLLIEIVNKNWRERSAAEKEEIVTMQTG